MAALKEETVSRLEGMLEIILPRVEKIDSLVESIARLEEQGKNRSDAIEDINAKLDKLCTEESNHIKKDDKENFVRIFLKREPILYLLGTMFFFQLMLVAFGIDQLLKIVIEYIKKQLGL